MIPGAIGGTMSAGFLLSRVSPPDLNPPRLPLLGRLKLPRRMPPPLRLCGGRVLCAVPLVGVAGIFFSVLLSGFMTVVN